MYSIWKLYYQVILSSVGGGKYLHLEIGGGISRHLAIGGGRSRHLAIGGGIYRYIHTPKIGGGMFNQINGYEHNFLEFRKKVGVVAPPFYEIRSRLLLMPQQNYLAPFAAIETPGENPPLVARRSRRGFKFLVYPNNFSK